MEFKTVDDILDFAIRKEEEAARMYTDLADRIENKAMREMLQDFAREEVGHKEELLQIKGGKLSFPDVEYVMDLKIAEYADDVEPSADLDYRKTLVLAMKREKAAFRLYTHLAAATDDPQLRTTLLNLAHEEAKHKLRFEIEYDDYVLTED